MVPIGFVIVHHTLQHCFGNFVDKLYLTIGLRVAWRSELVKETKVLGYILKENSFEMFTMVRNQLLGKAKHCYDMVKEKQCSGFHVVIICGNFFCPFGEIINGNHNVLMVFE